MTIDEQIAALAEASREQQRTLDKLKRLERIARMLITDEEFDRRLTELEQRGPRRPQ